MAPNDSIEVPDWCVIHQGLTTKHGCWEPSLGPWGLNIYPFYSSAGDLANFLLLRSSLSLFFVSKMRLSSLHHVLAFLLSPPLQIRLFDPWGQVWLRSARRRLWRRRWKLGLSRLWRREEVPSDGTHKNDRPSFYEGDHQDDHLSCLPIIKPFPLGSIPNAHVLGECCIWP